MTFLTVLGILVAVVGVFYALKSRSRRGLRNSGPPPARYSERISGENDVVLPPNFRILEGAPLLPLRPRSRKSPSMAKWASGLCPYDPEKGDIAGTGDVGPDTDK
jgi:hypothetical protein